MPNYTERTVLSKPRDFNQVANNSGSGGVVNNNVTVPVTNLPASVHVYQNGQKLIESQYVITAPATITIDANTHYDGSNYIVFAINII
jgi:hypothetical protein